jgi:hypothetical protein
MKKKYNPFEKELTEVLDNNKNLKILKFQIINPKNKKILRNCNTFTEAKEFIFKTNNIAIYFGFEPTKYKIIRNSAHIKL